MTNSINRRQFIQLCTLSVVATGISTTLYGQQSQNASANAKPPEYGLFPIALIEDAGLLAFAANLISDEDGEVALLSTMRARPIAGRKDYYHPGGKGRITAPLPVDDNRLEKLIEHFATASEVKLKTEKLAICFGWTCKNIAHQLLKPVYNQVNSDLLSAMQRAHDAALLQRYIEPGTSADTIETVLNTIHPRTLMRIHTLSNNPGDTGWIHRMSDYRKQRQSNNRQLALAIARHDSPEQLEYVQKNQFLNQSDPVINLVSKLRKGQTLKPNEIAKTLSSQANSSLYAKAIVRAVSDFVSIDKRLNPL